MHMMNLGEYSSIRISSRGFPTLGRFGRRGHRPQQGGSFQRTAKFRGPDLDSAVPAEWSASPAAEQRLAAARFGLGRLCRSATLPRQPISARPFPGCASALVDVERRAEFEQEGAHYESNYFLTFLYLRRQKTPRARKGFLYEGRDRRQDADARQVQYGFVDRTDRVLGLIEGFMPELRWIAMRKR